MERIQGTEDNYSAPLFDVALNTRLLNVAQLLSFQRILPYHQLAVLTRVTRVRVIFYFIAVCNDESFLFNQEFFDHRKHQVF